MIGRRVVLGLAVLCALVFSAFAAATASADTAYKCEAVVGEAGFSDGHCLTAVGSGATFKHSTAFPVNTPTAITATNTNTAGGTTAASVVTFKGVWGGVETEFPCTTVNGTGSMENKAEGGGATMWAQGTGIIRFSGCTVSKPSGKGCVLSGGEINTKKLFASTKGLTKQVKIEPFEGTEFFSLKIESCSVTGLNSTFPVTGSLIANTSGATTTATHATITTQNTLKFAGQKAGLDGALTIKDSNAAGVVTT